MNKNISMFSLEDILSKAIAGKTLSRSEILYLINLKKSHEINSLYLAARELRQKYFGNAVFLYGFMNLSTHCRNNCLFCLYRKENHSLKRYRKNEREIIDAAVALSTSGVNLLDLTTGEDPFFYSRTDGFEPLFQIVKEVKKNTGLPLMASFGCLKESDLKTLLKAGADWYACYQETHNVLLFNRLRAGQDYYKRLKLKYRAAGYGLLIEEGILTGVGELPDDLADSMAEMKKLAAQQVRVMNFIPQKGTPMQAFNIPHKQDELIIIAVLRLLFPDRLIPASLDVYGIDGLRNMLNAGANVITSIILPQSNMAGVAQSSLDIQKGHRTVEAITPILNELGLTKAATDDYISWILSEKKSLQKNLI